MSPPSLRILVVDDESDVREAVASLLETFLDSPRVRQAASGGEALRLLREAPVDLILSDYRMPGMNGVQFLNEASKLVPDAPQILVTAYDREAGLSLGAARGVPIVHKPFEPGALLSTLDEVLAPSDP